MKVTLKRPQQELIILAITWPSKRSKFKIRPSPETQFSGYDGHGLQELVRSDFEILDSRLDNFVYPEWPDDRFDSIVWAPLANVEFWQLIREFDPEAISELQSLVKSAPEFS